MFELLVAALAVVAGLVVFGLLGSIVALVCWVLVLPFKLLGLAFRGIAMVLALPFLLVFGIVGVAVFGVGALLFCIPALPLVLIAAFVWWLATRNRTARTA